MARSPVGDVGRGVTFVMSVGAFCAALLPKGVRVATRPPALPLGVNRLSNDEVVVAVSPDIASVTGTEVAATSSV
jgi:hypothetical protein